MKMNPLNVQKLLSQLGWGARESAKRIPKNRNTWGSETEQLENRALLSAASCDMAEPAVSAQVAHARRRAPVQYPDIAGQWDVTATGQFEGTGTVNITQDGKRVTSTINIEGIGEFTAKGTFKRREPFVLKFRTPRLDVPDFPIDVRLSVQINFPSGNLTPTTFTGTVKAPFVGTVGTLAATKAVLM